MLLKILNAFLLPTAHCFLPTVFMTTSAIAIFVVGLLGLFVVLWFVKRAVRMAVRLTLVVVLLLALVAGGLLMWWRGAPGEGVSPAQNARPASNRPARTR